MSARFGLSAGLWVAWACITLGSHHGHAAAAPDAAEVDMVAVHRIAWPAARAFFNDRIAGGSGQTAGYRDVAPLDEGAYRRPDSVKRRGDDWIVTYGGAPTGPTIVVVIGPAGEVRDVQGWFAAK